MKTKILIVEDDPHILLGLEELLKSEGYEVACCRRGDEALAAAAKHRPMLIVLDVMLPGASGYDVCKQLRAKKCTAPILMLTAKSQEIDKVVGLELGADDYVTKPFSPRELLARIRALLRRVQASNAVGYPDEHVRAYRFAGWELNTRLRRLKSAGGQLISLTNSEFSLLCAFLTSPQRVLSRDQLLERSRLHSLEVYDRSIDVTILRLRRKIESDPSNPTMLTTVRGAGYIFNSSVNVLR